MNTEIIYLDDNNFEDEQLIRGAELLAEGKTVVFPTETVYGLGANALDEDGVDKIYIAKGRPSDNPLIVHIGDIKNLDELVMEIPEIGKILMDRFWPGPLTLIFKKSDKVPLKVTGGLNTVAVRMPEHKVAKRLIELSGVPVAAPSANISGKPSPTSQKHVVKDLEGRVDMIICGGDAKVGVESTVLDITSEVPMILRPGGVTLEDLRAVVGRVDIDPHLEQSDTVKPKSPGMKYTHYSPRGEVMVVEGNDNDVIEYINKKSELHGKKGLGVGIISCEENSSKYGHGDVFNVGSKKNLSQVASNIFDALRYFDREDIKIIYTESFPREGIGQAIMNRLTKAAGYKIKKV